MVSTLLLVFLLGASTYAMPKWFNLKDEMRTAAVSSLLMPGPVLLPGNEEINNEPKAPLQDYCELCKLVVNEVDSLLKQNATEQEIRDELDKLCSAFPSITSECKEFVNDYVDPIIESLAHLDPNMVCAELGLCKSQYKEFRNEVNNIGATPQCELCQLLVQKLDSLITLNSTQEEIEQALQQVCNLLPSAYKTECDDLVKQYTPAILDVLANEFSPDMICSAIGLCSSSKALQAGPLDASNITCDMCLEILKFAKKLVEDNTTEANVIKMLDLMCPFMLPVIKECYAFIKETVPMVFDELRKMDPDAICKQLKMCSSDVSPNDIRCYLKGINRCQSPELARKCGAETFCKMLLLGRH